VVKYREIDVVRSSYVSIITSTFLSLKNKGMLVRWMHGRIITALIFLPISFNYAFNLCAFPIVHFQLHICELGANNYGLNLHLCIILAIFTNGTCCYNYNSKGNRMREYNQENHYCYAPHVIFSLLQMNTIIPSETQVASHSVDDLVYNSHREFETTTFFGWLGRS
ncbi:hypothetical protein ACJX0J_034552, partial [Zea mays]